MKYSARKIPPPRPPAGLSAEGRRWWKRIAEAWQLDAAAYLILAGAMECFDRMRQAQGMIATDGITISDRFGQIKQHPATMVERDAKSGLLRALKALNLDLEPLCERPGRQPGR